MCCVDKEKKKNGFGPDTFIFVLQSFSFILLIHLGFVG